MPFNYKIHFMFAFRTFFYEMAPNCQKDILLYVDTIIQLSVITFMCLTVEAHIRQKNVMCLREKEVEKGKGNNGK